MVTIQDVYYAVELKYMRECERRKIAQIHIGNGEFNFMYELVQHEIYRKLNITDTEVDIAITPVDVFTEYALPANYGSLRSYDIDFAGAGVRLELKDRTELNTAGNLVQGSPTKIAIYTKPDGLHYVYLSPISGFTGTLTVRYKMLTDITAGGGAGEDLTGLVTLPMQYKHLLIHGIMGQLLTDMQAQYYEYLRDANGDRAVPVKPTMNYNLGFDENAFNDTKLGN